jgi:hypothetical protein
LGVLIKPDPYPHFRQDVGQDSATSRLPAPNQVPVTDRIGDHRNSQGIDGRRTADTTRTSAPHQGRARCLDMSREEQVPDTRRRAPPTAPLGRGARIRRVPDTGALLTGVGA